MRHVTREDIIDYQTYNEIRSKVRQEIFKIKSTRRIHVGDNLTFIFENKETVKYQIQEMLLVEKIVKEVDIIHEIDTYNELLGKHSQLGCTLLIEIPDEQQRDKKLRILKGLMNHIKLNLEDNTIAPIFYDKRQESTDRLSSVQYLIFDCNNIPPVSISVDHPHYNAHSELTPEQYNSLKQDMRV